MGATDVLRGYWHPVARVSDIGAGPHAETVLDQRVVLYRSAPDEITAFEDLCMHRGSALSLGWVDDGNITCRYHGWSYDSSGMCVRIPTLAEGRRIPEKARLKKYRTTQRYGLVWVALEDPIQPVPEYPSFDSDELATMLYDPFRWQANAARIVENVLDYSHLPWVHEGMLGDREQPVYADVSPEILADGLTYELYDGTNNTTRHYRLFLPFTVLLSVTSHSPDGRNYSMLFTCCPVNNQETIQWFFTSRDWQLMQPEDDWRAFDAAVMDQDKEIVESQRPEELPLDLTEELHLRGTDAGTLAYRRMLRDLGVEWHR